MNRVIVLRLFSLIPLSCAVASACDCIPATPQARLEHSEIVFRGTIVELRDSNRPAPNPFPGFIAIKDTGKIAVFHVSRVWKGDVGEMFEMRAVEETSRCIGFSSDHLEVGTELLIYASKTNGEYYTGICGGDQLAGQAKDYAVIGPGKPPENKN